MDREKAQILILVEGERTDVRLMEHLLNIYGIGEKHRIVAYKTNIYALYNQMFRDTDPSDVDLLQLLREHEHDPSRKKMFDAKYSDILLIFDLDPQDSQFSSDKIMEMMRYFVESSDMGKLYLNYPMVEAFYHMKSIPDADYYSYCVSMQELREKRYKARVQAENRDHDYTKFAVTKAECNTVIKTNIEKALRISEVTIPPDIVEPPLPASADILSAQLDKIHSENMLSVLCTCVFYIPEYNPKLLF